MSFATAGGRVNLPVERFDQAGARVSASLVAGRPASLQAVMPPGMLTIRWNPRAASSLVALLLWIYYSAQIFLLGEAVSVMRDPVAAAIVPVGWPPLVEVLRATVGLGIPLHV